MNFTKTSIDFLDSPERFTTVGDFVNRLIPMSQLDSETENEIRAEVLELGFSLLPQQSRNFDSAIPGGFFEIQWHDHSVKEHDDDVCAPCLFCVIPFKTGAVSKSIYSSAGELTYFDSSGKKKTQELHVGEPLIFNPRKPHSLNYYGVEVKLIIFSVVKNKVHTERSI